MKWRLIPFKKYDPYLKTALNDVAMAHARATGEGVVWLAGWTQNCLNVGRSQQIGKEVNVEEAKRRAVPIVRRQGGGGAMYLTANGEITWQIVAPDSSFPREVKEIYREVCGTVVRGLETLGIAARHRPINDVVTTEGKKLSGSTVQKKAGVIYVGGTLLYAVNPKEMFSLLTPDPAKLTGKSIKSFFEYVTSISLECKASFDEVVRALQKALLEDKEYYEKQWTEEELQRAEKRAAFYKSDEWVFQR